jgi:hypothetical protein
MQWCFSTSNLEKRLGWSQTEYGRKPENVYYHYNILPTIRPYGLGELRSMLVSSQGLATPEAVSSIPLRRDLFDFVIFDEGSQSEVHSSITALYSYSRKI